jgi:hypothetical protein
MNQLWETRYQNCENETFVLWENSMLIGWSWETKSDWEETNIVEVKSFGKCFLRVHRCCGTESTNVPWTGSQTWYCKGHSMVLILKAWRGHGKQPRLGTGGGGWGGGRRGYWGRCRLRVIKVPRLKHHAEKMRIGIMKWAYEGLLVKAKSPVELEDTSIFGDASNMGWQPGTAIAVKWSQLEPWRQAVCYRGKSQRSDSKSLEEPRRLGVNSRHWTFSYLYCYNLILFSLNDYTLVLTSWNQKTFIFIFFWRPQLRCCFKDFGFLKENPILKRLNFHLA